HANWLAPAARPGVVPPAPTAGSTADPPAIAKQRDRSRLLAIARETCRSAPPAGASADRAAAAAVAATLWFARAALPARRRRAGWRRPWNSDSASVRPPAIR